MTRETLPSVAQDRVSDARGTAMQVNGTYLEADEDNLSPDMAGSRAAEIELGLDDEDLPSQEPSRALESHPSDDRKSKTSSQRLLSAIITTRVGDSWATLKLSASTSTKQP